VASTPAWRRRVLAAGVVVVALALGDRVTVWLEPRAAVGSAGVGAGTFPVVEVAGLGSRGGGFAALTAQLRRDGVPVLDFDAGKAGVQPLLYDPTDPDEDVTELAEDVVAPAIADALTRAGYDPDTQVVDVVSHSTGGLAMRALVETVPGWAARVDDLVLVAVPDHGSWLVYAETRGGGPFAALGADMEPGSAFLDGLGYAEPAGEVYTTFGGDPWLLRWAWPGGFDDQVPARSPFLEGAANNVYPSFHGRLLRNHAVIAKIAATLRANDV
jgi:triacylglycerol esterase/lipase EstA (alpha/beta hydrolase family)